MAIVNDYYDDYLGVWVRGSGNNDWYDDRTGTWDSTAEARRRQSVSHEERLRRRNQQNLPPIDH